MRAYTLTHLSDATLLRDLAALVSQDRTITAKLLAHIAEVDARRLYLPAGYPSMHAYCVEELRLSEDAAYKRIQAARAARQFPAMFDALADGRLNLTGVLLLAPHLTPGNAGDLLAAAAGKSKAALEKLLAQRFPRPELLPMVEALTATATPPSAQLAPERVAIGGITDRFAPDRIAVLTSRSVAPVAAERFALHVTIGRTTHDKLAYAQALLSHRIPSEDLVAVLDRALDALIGQLEKRKLGATNKPQSRLCAPTSKRYVPASRATCRLGTGSGPMHVRQRDRSSLPST